ncbi:hypothetical protein CVR96_26640, partial [Salmonella enterica subsp. enterica serovar Typhimurium]
MYKIITRNTTANISEFQGVQLAYKELDGIIIEDIRPENRSVEYVVNQLLADTDWNVGYVDNDLPTLSTNFYYISVKESLANVQALSLYTS